MLSGVTSLAQVLTIDPWGRSRDSEVRVFEAWKAKYKTALLESSLTCKSQKPADWISAIEESNYLRFDLATKENTNWFAKWILPHHPSFLPRLPTVTFAQVVDVTQNVDEATNSLYVLRFTLTPDRKQILVLEVFSGSSGTSLFGEVVHNLTRLQICSTRSL